MYVHLGGEVVVPVLEIVVVLDIRLVRASEINRELVGRAVAEKRLHGGGLDSDCKAIVITTQGRVYTSGISAPTLTKRMTHLQQSAKAWEAET
ncbi:MAG: extracellular matrix regulator RemB [bacterium]